MSEPNNQQQGNNAPPYPPVQEGSVPPMYPSMPAYTPIMLPYDVLPPEPLPQRNIQEGGYYLPSGRRTPGPGPYVLPMRVGATRRRRTFIIVLCFVLATILMLSGLALVITSDSSSDTANTGEPDHSSATVLQFDPPTY